MDAPHPRTSPRRWIQVELEQLLADGIIPSRRVDGQRVVDLDRVIAHKNHEDTLRLIRADFLLAEDHLPDEDHGLGRDI